LNSYVTGLPEENRSETDLIVFDFSNQIQANLLKACLPLFAGLFLATLVNQSSNNTFVTKKALSQNHLSFTLLV